MVEKEVRNMFEFVLCVVARRVGRLPTLFLALHCRLRATARSAARLSVSSLSYLFRP